jgi:hypothetical protein
MKEVIGTVYLSESMVNGNFVRLIALGRVLLLREGGELEAERFEKRADSFDDYRELLRFMLITFAERIRGKNIPIEYRDIFEECGVELID